jgi:APA family basic amino acid/polyamine antiporter
VDPDVEITGRAVMTFKRKLGLFDATMLVVGNVVGAGIFTTSGFLAGELPNPWLFTGIWIIGGLLTLCGALTYAEMTSMFPLSLTLGTIIVTALFVTINAVYLYAVPVDSLKGVVNVGQLTGERLMSGAFIHMLTLGIIFAIAASINATVLAGARLSYAIAKDGFFWSYLDKLHGRYETPHVALLVQATLAGLYVVVDTFENLLGAVVFIMLLSSMGSGLAHFILRMHRPLLERPYRTWGYPYTPIFFIISYSYIAVRIFLSSPIRSLLGVLITVSGIPFYVYGTRSALLANKGVKLNHSQ